MAFEHIIDIFDKHVNLFEFEFEDCVVVECNYIGSTVPQFQILYNPNIVTKENILSKLPIIWTKLHEKKQIEIDIRPLYL